MLPKKYSKEYIWSENYLDRFYDETVRITAQEHNTNTSKNCLLPKTLDRNGSKPHVFTTAKAYFCQSPL